MNGCIRRRVSAAASALLLSAAACGAPVVSSPPIVVPAKAAGILRRLPEWEAAADAARLAAAQAVDAADDDFELMSVRVFTGNDHFDGPTDPGQSFHIAVFLHKPTGLEYSLIPGGTFQMGSLPGDPRATPQDSPAHQVTLSNPFLICRTKVTCAAWQRIPSTMTSPTNGPAGNAPSDYFWDVPWEVAEAWCRNARLALPTEAQWEWAARGGTRGGFYFDGRRVHQFDCLIENPDGPPTGIANDSATARFAPNAFGLHDVVEVLADLGEWTRDGFYDYSPDPASDPDFSRRGKKVFRSPRWVGNTHGAFAVWTRGCKEDDWLMYRNTIGVRPVRDVRVVEDGTPEPSRPK